MSDTLLERYRPIIEAIRRERGRLTRLQLSQKYHLSYAVLDRLIAQFEIAVTRQPPEMHHSLAYDRRVAKRQLAAEIAAARQQRGPPYKPGKLEW